MAALPVVLAVSAGYGAGFTLDDRQLSLISAGGMGNNNGCKRRRENPSLKRPGCPVAPE